MGKQFCLLLLLLGSIENKSNQYLGKYEGYFSQKGQDKFLNEVIFKNKSGGTFIEVGAHDGISFSNTYFFERILNWTGLCIEPNPDIFKQLVQNRICNCEPMCIADHIGKMAFLKCTGFITEMYSGLIDYYDPRHLERIENEIKEYGDTKEIIWVPCTTLDAMVEKYNLHNIDLISIDIEGAELVAIKTLNFDHVNIHIIVIENNFEEIKIREFLESKGFKQIARIGKDDIFENRRWNEN